MYIPSKLDFSDLADILALYVPATVILWHMTDELSFRGTPDEPELAFDETAKAIAMNGVSSVSVNMLGHG